MYFRNFVLFSPLEEGGAFHLNKLESPLPKDALCQLWPSGSGEEDENVKSLRQRRRRQRQRRRQTTDKYKQKTSLEPSAEVS